MTNEVYGRDLIPGMLIYHDNGYSWARFTFVVSDIYHASGILQVTHLILRRDGTLRFEENVCFPDQIFSYSRAVM